MTAALVIFGIVYLFIALSKIPNAVVAIVGAVALLFLRVVTEEELFKHIDLEVIFLLAAMMSLANIAGRTGAFDWAAIKTAQLVKGDGFLILVLLSVLTAVSSAFLDNVTVVVLAVPITLSLCKTLRLDPIPFLLAQVFASNIGGATTIVGDPPNIIIASAAGIGFVEFINHITIPAVLSMIALIGLLFLWFRNKVTTDVESRQSIMEQRLDVLITDRGLLIKTGAVLGITVVGFMFQGLLHVSPAVIAMAGAALLFLVVRIDPHDVLSHVEWETLTFFVGLFILVGGLVETGAIERAQVWMVDISGGNDRNLAFIMVWFGGTASAIVDNIPFTATMTEIVLNITEDYPSESTSPLWWALVLGADLGGNATMVGASANVLVVSIARARGYPISFLHFMKYGIPIAFISMLISTGYIWIRYY
ncbi:MAG: ArsB/NhaD family transporter [Chloroflexi bacterium]|nr:ArsB/NhaD family transporter [Chloroflexota bacterium]